MLQCVTLNLNQVSLFGAGLAVAITADMIEGEEQMMFLVELGWQLNLKLCNKNKHLVIHCIDLHMMLSYTYPLFEDIWHVSYLIVEFGVVLVM